MTFELVRTSDDYYEKKPLPQSIEITFLEDLERLYHKVDCNLIIDFADKRIEIYDDYRE